MSRPAFTAAGSCEEVLSSAAHQKKKTYIYDGKLGFGDYVCGKKESNRPLRGDYYGGPEADDLPQRTEPETQHANQGIKEGRGE